MKNMSLADFAESPNIANKPGFNSQLHQSAEIQDFRIKTKSKPHRVKLDPI
jgi:hypothetical protein